MALIIFTKCAVPKKYYFDVPPQSKLNAYAEWYAFIADVENLDNSLFEVIPHKLPHELIDSALENHLHSCAFCDEGDDCFHRTNLIELHEDSLWQ